MALKLFTRAIPTNDMPKMSNVIHLPQRGGNSPRPANDFARAYNELTDAIILSRAAAGTLDPCILAALLAAVRQLEPECD